MPSTATVTPYSEDVDRKSENKREHRDSGVHDGDEERDSGVGDDSSPLTYSVPDGGYGWVIVACAFIFISIPMGISASFALFYEEWLDYFQAGKVRTALVGSLGSGCIPLLGSLGGMILTNLFDVRVVGMTGCLLATVAMVMSAFATDISVLSITYGIIGGSGMGLMFNSAYLSVGYYFEKMRPLATAIASSGTGFGTLFALLIARSIEAYTWRGGVFVLACITLQCVVLGALMRPLTMNTPYTAASADDLVNSAHNTSQIKTSNIRSQQACGERGTAGEGTSEVNNGFLSQEVKEGICKDGDMLLSKAEKKRNNGSSAPKTHPRESFQSSNELRRYIPSQNHRIRSNSAHCRSLHGAKIGRACAAHHHKFKSAQLQKDPRIHRSHIEINHHGNRDGHGDAQRLHRSHHELQQRHENHAHHRGIGRDHHRDQSHTHGNQHHQVHTLSPYSRKDVFLSSSMAAHLDVFTSTDYITSVRSLRVPTVPVVMDVGKEEGEGGRWHRTKAQLTRFFSPAIFRNPVFFLTALGMTLHHTAFFIPYTYIISLMKAQGLGDNYGQYMILSFGMANMTFKLIVASLSTALRLEQLLIVSVSLLFSALSALFITFCTTIPTFFVAAICYGGMSPIVTIFLTNIVVKYVGLEHLTNAFSLITVIRGLGSILGPPLAGFVIDSTGTTVSALYVGAIADLLAMTCFLAIWMRDKYYAKRDSEAEKVLAEGIIRLKGSPPQGSSPQDSDQGTHKSTKNRRWPFKKPREHDDATPSLLAPPNILVTAPTETDLEKMGL